MTVRWKQTEEEKEEEREQQGHSMFIPTTCLCHSAATYQSSRCSSQLTYTHTLLQLQSFIMSLRPSWPSTVGCVIWSRHIKVWVMQKQAYLFIWCTLDQFSLFSVFLCFHLLPTSQLFLCILFPSCLLFRIYITQLDT